MAKQAALIPKRALCCLHLCYLPRKTSGRHGVHCTAQFWVSKGFTLVLSFHLQWMTSVRDKLALSTAGDDKHDSKFRHDAALDR